MARKKKAAAASRAPTSVRITAHELGIPGTSSVEVGYSAPYADFVEGGTRKMAGRHFLSRPLDALLPEALPETAQEAYQEGGTVREALLAAGQELLSASLPLVPVQTGRLRASAFVRIRRATYRG